MTVTFADKIAHIHDVEMREMEKIRVMDDRHVSTDDIFAFLSEERDRVYRQRDDIYFSMSSRKIDLLNDVMFLIDNALSIKHRKWALKGRSIKTGYVIEVLQIEITDNFYIIGIVLHSPQDRYFLNKNRRYPLEDAYYHGFIISADSGGCVPLPKNFWQHVIHSQSMNDILVFWDAEENKEKNSDAYDDILEITSTYQNYMMPAPNELRHLITAIKNVETSQPVYTYIDSEAPMYFNQRSYTYYK